jgi:carbon storage regulator CsrA
MLVVSRRPGEQVRIGDGITLTVIEVVGCRIKLGIEAPRHIPIFRGELGGSGGGSPAHVPESRVPSSPP